MHTLGAQVRLDLRRLVALIVCVVVLLAPLHLTIEGNQNSPSAAAFESSDLSGGSHDPDGAGKQHGAHCPCGVVVAASDAAIPFPHPHTALRFTPGPSGNLMVAPPPTPPPPRS
jgi:hypothetical protein